MKRRFKAAIGELPLGIITIFVMIAFNASYIHSPHIPFHSL